MHPATPSSSQQLNDSDILHILLKLSNHQPVEWEPQFPLLDPHTVSQVAQSISDILCRGRSDLKKNLVPVVRKWCTGMNKSNNLAHSAWIGRSITVQETVESILSIIIPILEDAEDWGKRDLEQQMALCYALLGAATDPAGPLHPQAGETCALLACRILKEKQLQSVHHRFLSRTWSYVGVLPIKIDVLVSMAERSFLGVEGTLIWLGRKAVSCNQNIDKSFDTIVGSTILKICSESSVVFQKVCEQLTHMMVVSEAHPGIQALIKTFILRLEVECASQNLDICTLYEESCQILSALLCVEPSLLPDHGKDVLSRDTVFQMLNDLPRKKAASLLSHRPNWLLFTL